MMMIVKELFVNGWDDQYVQLQGCIVKYVGGEDYEFVDVIGMIYVEIDYKLWVVGQFVSDKNEVKLIGEFECKWLGCVKVDVDYVEVLC